MAQLRYLDEADHVRTAELGAAKFLIGRVASCNITFVDDMVSREHSEIRRIDDGRFRIRDLGSRNKTYVNGQLITETVLTGGDVVRIGEHILEFLDDQMPTGRVNLEFLTPDRQEPPGCEWIKIRAPVTLSLEQLGRLAGVAGAAGVVIRPEDVAESALSHLTVDLQAERGFVALRGEGKKDIRVIAQRGLVRGAGEGLVPVSQTFAYSALLQQVAGRYPQNASQIDEKAGYATTAMVAPLLHRREIVGLAYVDQPTGKKIFSTAALQQFSAAGAQLGALLAAASRQIVSTAGREGAAAMANLRRLQTLMAPVGPQLPDFESASRLIPGQGRCGDICDLIGIDDGNACAVIVDAGGQGVVGMAQAAAIRTALRAALTVPDAPLDLGALFNALNRAVASMQGRQFIGCCAAHIDIAAGRIHYVNAGGSIPLLLPAPTRMQSLDQPSLILGVDADYTYEATAVDLPPQFRLVLHTDGLLDCCNAAGEGFGDERFKNVLLERNAFAAPAEMVELVCKAFNEHLAGHPLADDALIMVVAH
ncbi:MAG: SpoIIE family protein phosphatase [Planctomycetota bacterium]|jgi:serine phosphatase RsbU (regulator of sigma subunit)